MDLERRRKQQVGGGQQRTNVSLWDSERGSMSLSQESVLSFLLDRGGEVRNSELVSHFKALLSAGAEAQRQRNRELFKRLVNSVAVVKQSDGVKFVVVKKRYQDFVKDAAQDPVDHGSAAQSATFLPPAAADRRISAETASSRSSDYGEATEKRRALSSPDSTTLKVLNISGEQQSGGGKSGPVFAVIAVKSPPRNSAPATKSQSRAHRRGSSDKQSSKVSELPAAAPNISSCRRDSLNKSQGGKSAQTEDIPAPHSPPLRPQHRTTRDDANKYPEPVPLEPLAHEWLVKCAAGLWGQIHALLLRDTRLAHRKDFMSGLTALHWAAKDGNTDMIDTLMQASSKGGPCVNINSKSHGGYTPLHIAAIHGRTEVLLLLVQRYGASVTERDNSGKKAFHYLQKGASAELRALLGGRLQGGGEKLEEDFKEHTRALHGISKLFHPHTGKKAKINRFAHEW